MRRVDKIWREIEGIKDRKINKREFEKLYELFRKICEHNEIDEETIDFRSIVAITESYYENVENILNWFRENGYSIPKNAKDIKEEAERMEREALEKEAEYYKRERDKAIAKIKERHIPEIEKYYRDLYNNVEVLVKSKDIHGLIVYGSTGLGKTFNVIYKLEKMKEEGYNIEYELVTGHITALELYQLLYHNKEKIIVIDDIPTIYKNETIKGILLSALWGVNNKRIIRYFSTSSKLKVPPLFEFKGKIVFITNEFKKEFKALKSRCFIYNLEFNNDDVLKIMYELAKKEKIDFEVIDFIKEEVDKNKNIKLNLRILKKAKEFWKYNKDWKRLLKLELLLNYDKGYRIVAELIAREDLTEKEKIHIFTEETGLSRRTYFYYKDKLKTILNR